MTRFWMLLLSIIFTLVQPFSAGAGPCDTRLGKTIKKSAVLLEDIAPLVNSAGLEKFRKMRSHSEEGIARDGEYFFLSWNKRFMIKLAMPPGDTVVDLTVSRLDGEILNLDFRGEIALSVPQETFVSSGPSPDGTDFSVSILTDSIPKTIKALNNVLKLISEHESNDP